MQVVITSTSTVLSVTGVICYIGLIAGALFALSMVLSDDRLARRVLNVILLSSQEHQWLQAKVTESSKILAIAPPKIGVVEDLRPNAFTIGYGRRATIVFSIGLINLLSKEEVVAVASHELAHVKNNDFFFKTISNALTTVSFFNPLAYISSSTAQREREMLADERAVELLEKPSDLADALAKICKALQNLPKETMLGNFSSNLLVSSSVLHRVGILSTHPRLDTRLRNISAPKSSHKHWSRRNTNLALVLSMFLIISAVAVSLAMADLQVNFAAEFTASRAIPTDFTVTGYHVGPGNITILPAAPFDGVESIHVLIYSPNLIYRNSYAETGNNADLSMHEVVAGEFFIMHSQNSSIDPMQAAVYLPGGIWMG
jgi:Zn-dependent protease with chaperone function